MAKIKTDCDSSLVIFVEIYDQAFSTISLLLLRVFRFALATKVSIICALLVESFQEFVTEVVYSLFNVFLVHFNSFAVGSPPPFHSDRLCQGNKYKINQEENNCLLLKCW